MKLGQLLNIDLLDAHRREGFVGCQIHPTLPLRIYNYTPRAAFANAWGDGTLDYCRGLIVDNEDNIVARPFKKFHNLGTPSIPETMAENLPPYLPEITKKMDGSLGIWYPDGTPSGAIATRGSFTSPQALWATKRWKEVAAAGDKRQRTLLGPWEGFWTPLFEIIYPDNRIVVDYGGFSGLVCIGGVYLESGRDVGRLLLVSSFGDMLVDTVAINHKDMLPMLEKFNIPNEEGYVARYSNGLRVKIKFEDYKRLHRIITGVNPRSLWELISSGKGFETDGLPANFVAWADKWWNYFTKEHDRILTEAVELHGNRPFREAGEPDRVYRASYARFVMRETKGRDYLKPILFDLFDGYEGSKVIWKMLEPAGNDMRFSTAGIDATADV